MTVAFGTIEVLISSVHLVLCMLLGRVCVCRITVALFGYMQAPYFRSYAVCLSKFIFC